MAKTDASGIPEGYGTALLPPRLDGVEPKMGDGGWADGGPLRAGAQELRRLGILRPRNYEGVCPAPPCFQCHWGREANSGGMARMTGLPGLPALDRTLLPKPRRDLWPDSALEMGRGEGAVCGMGPLGPELEQGRHPGWLGKERTVTWRILWQRRESGFVTWQCNNKIPCGS